MSITLTLKFLFLSLALCAPGRVNVAFAAPPKTDNELELESKIRSIFALEDGEGFLLFDLPEALQDKVRATRIYNSLRHNQIHLLRWDSMHVLERGDRNLNLIEEGSEDYNELYSPILKAVDNVKDIINNGLANPLERGLYSAPVVMIQLQKVDSGGRSNQAGAGDFWHVDNRRGFLHFILNLPLDITAIDSTNEAGGVQANISNYGTSIRPLNPEDKALSLDNSYHFNQLQRLLELGILEATPENLARLERIKLARDVNKERRRSFIRTGGDRLSPPTFTGLFAPKFEIFAPSGAILQKSPPTRKTFHLNPAQGVIVNAWARFRTFPGMGTTPTPHKAPDSNHNVSLRVVVWMEPKIPLIENFPRFQEQSIESVRDKYQEVLTQIIEFQAAKGQVPAPPELTCTKALTLTGE